MSGKGSKLSISQSLEGLYTPRYENYNFNIIGLPFKPKKIIADGKEVTNFDFGKEKNLEFKFSKNFKQIEIHK